jgi:phage terminase small subunit
MSKETSSIPRQAKSKLSKLSKQERKFIEIKAETGNGTLAAKEAFGIDKDNNAAVKAHELLRNPKIVNALQEALPDELLAKVHKEGLEATREDQPDFAVRHKYLDSAYKLKGSYAAEKHLNINLEVNEEERNKILGIASKVIENMTHEEVKS